MPRALAPFPPLVREVFPNGDPFASLSWLPGAFALRSSLPDPGSPHRQARWTLFGAQPFAMFRGGAAAAALREHFAESARRMGPVEGDGDAPPPPFTGGAVGYWAYDYGRRLERLPMIARDDLGLPELVVGLYDVVGAHDHDSGRTWLFSSGLPMEGDAQRANARVRLARFRERVEFSGQLKLAASQPPAKEPRRAVSTFSADAYRAAVEDVREAIRRGDIFQANLSQRWSLPLERADAHAVWFDAALRAHTPSPFAASLLCGDHAVLSASPESFLHLRGADVLTRPIKGTRPRGATPDADARLAAELQASSKDRAENVMIVDVLRNDLGRVCETGSVRVPELCALERFPQVWHLTSTVTGKLRAGTDAFQLLDACFPGGSITGAPKLRAMEILEALEPVRRHLYTGAIGWVGWNGDADWSIAIRTATATARGLHWSAGGGITADSDPDAEYLESLAKAEGLRVALSSVLGEIELTDPTR